MPTDPAERQLIPTAVLIIVLVTALTICGCDDKVPLLQEDQEYDWISLNKDTTPGWAEGIPNGEINVRDKTMDLWPDEQPERSGGGYLVSGDGIPLRALASGFDIPLFESNKTEYPRGVIAIMKPFVSYRVHEQRGKSLAVSEEESLSGDKPWWVRAGDVYIWHTGEEIVLNSDMWLYTERAKAEEANTRPSLEEKHNPDLVPMISDQDGHLTRLPLLTREGDVLGVLSPYGGGTLCWLNKKREADRLQEHRIRSP